jgi:hypothetical protein
MAFDPKCFDLADAFLEDHSHLWTKHRTDELAQIIQRAIDNYIAAEQDNYEPPDPIPE